MTFHNSELAELVRDGDYRAEDLSRIEAAFDDHHTLTFVRLPSGLYPASSGGASIASSGYARVWVRDNIYVALAHHQAGATHTAAEVVHALTTFFIRHRSRFDDIISGAVDPHDVARRPHVRFDGISLSEIADERWAHAQNDALGYLLWLSSMLAANGAIGPDADTVSILALLVRYFQAIRFWEDEDSGHWEEQRKLSASSVGTVVAGVEAFLTLIRGGADASWRQQLGHFERVAAGLSDRGRRALDAILPHECAQVAPTKNRRYDAALLFLLFPLNVITDRAMTELVLHDVDRFLVGEHGVRRYLSDSYWAPDYDVRLPPSDRTRDFSVDMESRDGLLSRIGDEAQWCLFDPIISAYYGRRFLSTGADADRTRQVFHFNRSLAQVTPDWRCAELYYLRDQEYVPNPHVPLQWTQANLLTALQGMRATIARRASNTAAHQATN
jgi:phosphorylase kinase alpha/beta subunit